MEAFGGRTQQSLTGRQVLLHSGWSGRAEHMAWPAGESLCSVSGAESRWWLEKGGVSRGTKGCHLEGIYSEWGALITGCHCQLPAGSQRRRAAPIPHTQSSASCRRRQQRATTNSWLALRQGYSAQAPNSTWMTNIQYGRRSKWSSLSCRYILYMCVNNTPLK